MSLAAALAGTTAATILFKDAAGSYPVQVATTRDCGCGHNNCLTHVIWCVALVLVVGVMVSSAACGWLLQRLRGRSEQGKRREEESVKTIMTGDAGLEDMVLAACGFNEQRKILMRFTVLELNDVLRNRGLRMGTLKSEKVEVLERSRPFATADQCACMRQVVENDNRLRIGLHDVLTSEAAGRWVDNNDSRKIISMSHSCQEQGKRCSGVF